MSNLSAAQAPLAELFSLLSNNETAARGRIHLIASENTLSPLAKLPFLLDAHTRYFLDDFHRFGKWLFPSGESIGELEQHFLIPMLSELSGATYVNARPISGMNCMLIALASFTKPNDVVLTIPVEQGGHVSTEIIVKTLGLEMQHVPFLNAYDIDYALLEKLIEKTQPALIYFDQANMLFPLDPQPIRHITDAISPHTILHYDSSHTNGLIFGKAMFNPLDQGAHCYGGSTHKTLPGPHKGFLATNDPEIAQRIENKANHLVSHHHTSSSLSLMITLLEMKYCGGDEYANRVILNTKAFAQALHKNGFQVAAEERGYTACHQTWMTLPQGHNSDEYFAALTQAGIMVNHFDGLPGIQQQAFRLSCAELTRMGGTHNEAEALANIMSTLLKTPHRIQDVQEAIQCLRQQISKPSFCFNQSDVDEKNMPHDISMLCKALFNIHSL